jgi:hypothetical protein
MVWCGVVALWCDATVCSHSVVSMMMLCQFMVIEQLALLPWCHGVLFHLGVVLFHAVVPHHTVYPCCGAVPCCGAILGCVAIVWLNGVGSSFGVAAKSGSIMLFHGVVLCQDLIVTRVLLYTISNWVVIPHL